MAQLGYKFTLLTSVEKKKSWKCLNMFNKKIKPLI